MAPWIMNSEVTRHPWTLTFRIGSLPVAMIHFENKKPVLEILGGTTIKGFKTVSEAMSKMHELLNSPPQYIDATSEIDGYREQQGD